MRRTRWHRIVFGGLLFLIALTANTRAKDFEVGFGFGNLELDDGMGTDASIRLDVRAGLFVSRSVELEAQFVGASEVFGSSYSAYLVNGIFQFRANKTVVPYVLGGVGTAKTKIRSFFGSQTGTLDGFLAQFAAGTRFRLGKSKRNSIRLEVSALSGVGGSATHYGVTAGYSYRFGGGANAQ